MFSQYCAEPFSYEQVDTVLPDGSRTTSPDMSTRRVTADVPYAQNLSGLKLDAHQMQAILGKMQLACSVSPDAAQLLVDVPVTRSDVRAAAPHLLIPRAGPCCHPQSAGASCVRRGGGCGNRPRLQ
jgi:phenylalanyl-tRNA synthetase beta subunit